MPRALITVVASVAVLLFVAVARADDDPKPTDAKVEDETTLAARKEFVEGTALVRAERWGEALASFERASKLKAHAITTYNIAQCERAMGQFTRARQALVSALKQNETSNGSELPESVVGDAKAMQDELERILPRATITLDPADGAVTVDGRPLESAGTIDAGDRGSVPVFVTGTMAPGPGSPPGAKTFQIVTNPGPHVITVARPGYQDVVVTRVFAARSTPSVDLVLDRLPATIHVTSNLADAVVRVNESDVGNTPVDVSRAAGRYHVVVARKGFVPFETDVTLQPGGRVELPASLREDKPALTQRWWFWAGVGVIVAGAATVTYFAARSSNDPQRPPTDGGGLGWSLQVP